ncbi:TetR/AcrR family transcriptional regulator [Kribbella sp. CA-293567]|uniref:TetR/AcrR family transcriptional regulator n=1 Tax=Kribbella sp. CA-293567 TaxID=3002436 RepID=UPI0022DD42B1|nr:TetR family transcriptional regulator [Kribbella sp. CA-293567]WBQ05453.1 TetR family transcriptional regulator [Kribbella sp. CA-293567]
MTAGDSRPTTQTGVPARGKRSGDQTRATILTAARERFAADGYERATIRAIAADAAIDPAMVMRYFGTKEKLFAAAAEFDLRLPDLSGLPREQVGAALTNHFLDRWEDDESLKALLRASVTNEVAADRMRQLFAEQLGPMISTLADPATAATRAGLVATQALGFALCRYVLALPPVAALSREEAVAWLGPTITRYLTGSLSD